MRNLTTCALLGAILLAGCGGGDSSTGGGTAAGTAKPPATSPATSTTAATTGRFPDIRKATLTRSGGAFTLSVTVSSPYDTPQRYADGWRVLAAGTTRVLGRHTLDHDHADEQPFVREQPGLKLPADVTRITVEGRDQKYGYGGGTVTIAVPR